jgi:hypothetical protein
MSDYPYSSAYLLTDDIYSEYTGETTKGTEMQRNAALFIAERLAASHIKTFFTPTIITGTYLWPTFGQPLMLDHVHINSISDVTAISSSGDCNCSTREDDGCAYLLDAEFGVIHIRMASAGGYIGCGCGSFVPYQARVTYETGLSSGTANQPDILMALSTVADEILNEIAEPSGNETPGAHGIIRWANQGYTEERMPLINTALGNSPRANFAARLLDQAVPNKRVLRL